MGLQNSKNGTCLTNLTCFMDQGGEDVTYSWESLGQAANESHNGSILPISWRLGERDTIFICVVRNPISSNSSNPIFARKLCEGDSLSSLSLSRGLGSQDLYLLQSLVPLGTAHENWRPPGTYQTGRKVALASKVGSFSLSDSSPFPVPPPTLSLKVRLLTQNLL